MYCNLKIVILFKIYKNNFTILKFLQNIILQKNYFLFIKNQLY